jgi:hypothetical protein
MSMNDDDVIRHFQKLAEAQPVSVPPVAMQRWRRALDGAAQPALTRAFAPSLRFAGAAALVFAVSVGISLVAHREGSNPAVPGVEGPLAATRSDRGLQLHLVDLESQLSTASELPPSDRAGEIRRLAQQNRIQTAAAERSGGARDARVLRAFTVMLEAMASSNETNGEFKAALAQLHFEMNVMQERLASTSPSLSVRRLQAL